MDNAKLSDRLDREIMDGLMQEFNNPGQLMLGLFQETLSDTNPQAGLLGKHLLAVKDQTCIVFQAKTAWSVPFIGAETVTCAKAINGIQFAYQTYNATHVEIYVADVLDQQKKSKTFGTGTRS